MRGKGPKTKQARGQSPRRRAWLTPSLCPFFAYYSVFQPSVQFEAKNPSLVLSEAIAGERERSGHFGIHRGWRDTIHNFRNLKHTVSLHFKILSKRWSPMEREDKKLTKKLWWSGLNLLFRAEQTKNLQAPKSKYTKIQEQPRYRVSLTQTVLQLPLSLILEQNEVTRTCFCLSKTKKE